MKDNYTPLHNEVLEALCKINLSPYETRVLFCIWRKTYGFIDKITKERKKYDWIAGNQISQMTNLDRRHVSRALKGLKDKHVINRDDKKTSFSKEFMNLMSSIEMTSIPNKDSQLSSIEMTVINRDDKKNVPLQMTPTPSRDDNLSSVEGHTKENKRNYTKENSITTDVVIGEPIKKDTNFLIGLFKGVNPSYERLFPQKGQRDAVERLVKKYGADKVENMILALPDIVSQKFAPNITTPYTLESKLGDLLMFLRKEKYGQPKISVFPESK